MEYSYFVVKHACLVLVSIFSFVGLVEANSAQLSIFAMMPQTAKMVVSDTSTVTTTLANLGVDSYHGIVVGMVSVQSNTGADQLTIISQNDGLKSRVSSSSKVGYSVTLSSVTMGKLATVVPTSSGVSVPVNKFSNLNGSSQQVTLAVSIPDGTNLQSGTYYDKMVVQLASL